jgi:hypothetical protein
MIRQLTRLIAPLAVAVSTMAGFAATADAKPYQVVRCSSGNVCLIKDRATYTNGYTYVYLYAHGKHYTYYNMSYSQDGQSVRKYVPVRAGGPSEEVGIKVPKGQFKLLRIQACTLNGTAKTCTRMMYIGFTA